jgi:hypothetical protein
MHLNDGQIRAFVDHEASLLEGQAVSAHLDGCPSCRARLAQMQARAERVGEMMAGLAAQVPGPARPPRQVLAQIRARRETASRKESSNVFQSVFSQRQRSMWIGLGTLAALVLAFSFAPVRTWAGEFLGLFRVQNVAVLPVDITRFSQLNNDSTLADQISQLFSNSVTVTREPGEAQVVASADAASQAAGFHVRLLTGSADTPEIAVQGGAAFDFVVDRAAAQAILNEAGRSDLQLPEALDGATIAVDVPAGVTAAYGSCPDLKSVDGAEQSSGGGAGEGRQFDPTGCIMLAQVPSPTVETPPDVDVTQLAEIGLQFTGMTADEARAFSQTVDWTSTLVIPIPRQGTTYEQVSVDGVNGNLIARQSDSGVWDRYTLVWVKDGIVYALTGYGDKDEGLRLANSLQ